MELVELKAETERNSQQVNEMVAEILSNKTTELDSYIENVRTLFLNVDKIMDEDLDKIILQIPVYIYYLIHIIQDIEVHKGISAESSKYKENQALLEATGTVVEKQSKASNAVIQDRIVQLAYKTASATLQAKMNAAMEILSSAKKVQQRRLEEMKLTKTAGSSVSF